MPNQVGDSDLFTREMLRELHTQLFNNTRVLATTAGLNFSTAHRAVSDPTAPISVDTISKLRLAYNRVVLKEGGDARADGLPADLDPNRGFLPDSTERRCDSCQRERQVPTDFYRYFKDRDELRPTCKFCMGLERKLRSLGMHRAERFQMFRVYLGEVRWPPDPENLIWATRAKEWVRRRSRPLASDLDKLRPPAKARATRKKPHAVPLAPIRVG